MKKKIKNILLAFSAIFLLFSFISCMESVESESENSVDNYGSAKVKLFVPNYDKIAENNSSARAVAPQTSKVKFSYKFDDEETITLDTINLSDASSTRIENAEEGLFGNIYTIVFSGIYTGTYSKGTMQVDLLDSAENVITTGTNNAEIIVSKDSSVKAEFYTTPSSTDNENASLEKGEMKFFVLSLEKNNIYTLDISVSEGETVPDVVIFNSDGSYKEYKTGSSITFEKSSETRSYFAGIYAKNSACTYTTSLTAVAITDYDTFNETGFGDDSLDSSFKTSTTASSSYKAYVTPTLTDLTDDYDGDGKAVKFDYKYLRTSTSSITTNVYLENDSLITFAYITDITENYDGVLNFYIDGVLQDSGFTGKNGSWHTTQYSVSSGSHTLEWRALGAASGYTSGITNTVYLDAVKLSKAAEAPSTLNETFTDNLDASLWVAGGVLSEVSTDEIFESWTQYGDALVDTHGKVYALKTYDGSTQGNSTLKIFSVKPTVDSTLSFEYKLDLYTADYLKVYVDGEEKFSETGYGQTWRTASIDISAGTHTITFSAEKTDNYRSASQTNAAYIDNVTLVADTTESVDISPKGTQETYIGGFDIQFSAAALRSDGSSRSGRTVSWTATGGSIDENGLFSPGSTSGTYTVTATIDGKTASNTTVVVHGEDYLEDSVTIGGETFTGYSGTTGTKSTGTVSFSKAPSATSFSADGFFVLKGTVSNSNASNYAMVKIESGDDETFVLLKDTFYTRVWLRFGTENKYTVTVYDLTSISLSGECYTGCGMTTANAITYTVTNTHSLDNADQLMPSYYCQGDDFLVSNAVNAVLAELPSDATVGQKLQALHDWEIHRMHYDNVSLNNSSQRKLQDAVSVVKNKMGVCEGYANLYAALARSIGIRTKYQASSSMNHGWVQCCYNDEWKLLDATWDDPVSSSSDSNTEKNPYAENYKYFLIATTGVSNDHYSDSTDNGRAAISVKRDEYRPYALPGSY